jgi:hypothetical protein
MESHQTDDADSVIDFPLIDDPEETGQTRIELDENIHQHEASGFSIVLREQHVVHGTWAAASPPAMGQKASLLVYRVELYSDTAKENRRFKHLSLKFRLERVPKGKPAQDPYVASLAPAQGMTVVLLPTEVQRSRESTTQGAAEAGAGAPVPVKFSIMREDKVSAEWLQLARVKICGSAKKTLSMGGRNRLGDDRIEWAINENPKQATIPDSYGLAILLKRSDEEKFKIVFDFKLTVDFWYDLAKINPFNGWMGRSRTYDPSEEKSMKRPEGITLDSLGELAQGSTLDERFSFVHLPEEMQPVRVYSSNHTPPSESRG